MYKISQIKSDRQGDEIFRVEFADGTDKKFHIWDYSVLYKYPHLYRHLIVELLDCKVYEAIEHLLHSFIPSNLPLRIADIACGSGLMGKQLKNSGKLTIDYLAGVEIITEAITALERDTPDVYDKCFLLDHDDLSQLKEQNINCLLICGAANHLTLKDYQYYLSLLSEQAYVAFNLLSEPSEQHRKEILNWMDQHYRRLENQCYTHRKLLNGSLVKHEVFIYGSMSLT